MLEVKNIKKEYPKFSLDCSLKVKEGQVTGLIGQNGSGKSTTFKAILGLIKIDSGSISLFDKPISQVSVADKEDIGVVLADSGFSGYLTLKDIMPVLSNLYKKFDRDFFIKQVDDFGLPWNKKIKELSTGMKVKIKILVAMSHKAKLLILDEPTAGLDVVARDELLDILRMFLENDENNSILISSHISSDLESLCDDLYMIDQGKIILHEDTDVLLSDYGMLKVNEEQFVELDKNYLLKVKKENFGYSCLTNQKQFYLENFPSLIVENGSIDEVITMMSRGDK